MAPAIIASLPAILDLISKMAPGFAHLINYVSTVRTVLKQSEEWTPELESAFVESLLATKTDPAYRLDPKPES